MTIKSLKIAAVLAVHPDAPVHDPESDAYQFLDDEECSAQLVIDYISMMKATSRSIATA